MPILITLTVSLLLIFPFFPSVYFYLKKDEKSAGVFVKIFGIKVFCVNATLNNNGLYVKKTFKKPYSAKLSFPKSMRGNIEKIKKIGILSVDSVFKIGLKDNDFYGLLGVSVLQNVHTAVFNALKADKPHLKLNNKINVYDNSTVFDAALKVKAVFNVIDVLSVLFYNLTEKIHYGIAK